MHQPAHPRNPEPQVVKACKLVFPVHLRRRGLEDPGAVELHPSEVEIVPQGPFLILDDGDGFVAVEVVGVQHGGHSVVGYLHHALKTSVHEAESGGTRVKEGIIGIGLRSGFFDGPGAEVREPEDFHSIHVSKLRKMSYIRIIWTRNWSSSRPTTK